MKLAVHLITFVCILERLTFDLRGLSAALWLSACVDADVCFFLHVSVLMFFVKFTKG